MLPILLSVLLLDQYQAIQLTYCNDTTVKKERVDFTLNYSLQDV